MRRNPLVPVAIAFMTGIACQHWLTGLPDWFWWAMAAVAALIAAILLIVRRKPSLMPTLLAALLCIAGIGGTLGQTCDPRSNPNDWCRLAACDSQLQNNTGRPSPVYLTLHLTETPQPLERSWHTKATVERCNGATCDGKIDLYSGNDDQVVPLLAMGGIGVISVVANIAPEAMHDMCAKFFAGDIEGAAKLQRETYELFRNLFSEVNPIPVKKAVNFLGQNAGALRMPLTEMEPEHAAKLKKAMEDFGLI